MSDPNASPSSRPNEAAPDTIREPDNSTVDDWLGQRVQRDEERIDQLLEETGGDTRAAESKFEASSDEADDYRAAHEQS